LLLEGDEMSYSSEMTRKRIVECAEEEFFRCGYEQANLRTIAQNAKVTTGALYNHFKGKSELFDELVREPGDELFRIFKAAHDTAHEQLEAGMGDEMMQTGNDGTDFMLDYIYDHYSAFRLIFCYSKGSDYEYYLKPFITIEEETYRRGMSENHALEEMDDFFIHVISTTGFQYLAEVVTHDLSKAQAVQFMEKIKRFTVAGWAELMAE